MNAAAGKHTVHEIELHQAKETMPPPCKNCTGQYGYQVTLAFNTLLIIRCANCNELVGSVDQETALY